MLSHSASLARFSLFLLAFVTHGVAHAEDLQVMAAASLTDAMKEIAPGYEKQSGNKLQFNFGGSNALARQIREGAPADVFVSADNAQMDGLQKAGVIVEKSRQEILSNILVIVIGKDSALVVASPKSLAQPAIKRLALADPKAVPAGVYAREYLTKLGLWKELEARVIPTENVRAALAAVESGNADAGIVYKTDAGISKSVKIAFEVPAKDGPQISYPAAVVKSSAHADAAKKFVAYLQSEPAKKVFQKFGFIIPK
ncbi:MAG: molybdate ABC transporter substrate-binding protein [Chthoniobacterales bacterium]